MEKSFSIIALILCFAMIFTFVGCGETMNNNEENQNQEIDNNAISNSEKNNDEVNNNEDEIEEEDDGEIAIAAPQVAIPDGADLSEHMTINYMGRNTNQAGLDQYTMVTDELERLFNITLDFAPASGKNNDMDLIAAADAVPECAWIYLGSTDKAWTLYRDGLTRSIPMEYVQKYAPYMWLSMQDDKSFHPTQLVPGTEDEYYTLFCGRYNMYKLGSGTVVRLDWLENLGISPKGSNIETIVEDHIYITDEAYLLNEFTDLIYEFTYSDPDMNSENDTIGLDTFGLNVDDFGYGGTLYSACSVRSGYTPDENGWGIPMIFSDANFKFFKQLGEWKTLGVIPNGFETKSANDWIKMWASGKYGASAFEQKQLSIDVDKYGKDGFVDDSMPLILFNENPDAKIILTPPLLASDGTGGHGRSYHDYIRAAHAGYFYVREDVSDEKLKRILMLYDYMSCNPDGLFFCCFGVYGVHWGYDSKNNRITLPQDDLSDEEKWEGFEFFYTPNVANTAIATSFPLLDSKNEGTFLNTRTAMTEYSQENWPTLGYAYLEADLPNDWTEGYEWLVMSNMRARNNAYKEARSSIVDGNSDPEAVWDNLINTMKSLGFDEYVEGVNNNAYLRDELFFDGTMLTPAEKFPLD